MRDIFRKKDLSNQKGEFHRSLGLLDVTFIGLMTHLEIQIEQMLHFM